MRRRDHVSRVPPFAARETMGSEPSFGKQRSRRTAEVLTQEQFRSCTGRKLADASGNKIGKIDDVYTDTETGQPEWFAVHTGMFGNRVSFVPTTAATFNGDDVVVPYDKGTVKDAPNAEADGALSPQEEEALYRHYGVQYGNQ